MAFGFVLYTNYKLLNAILNNPVSEEFSLWVTPVRPSKGDVWQGSVFLGYSISFRLLPRASNKNGAAPIRSHPSSSRLAFLLLYFPSLPFCPQTLLLWNSLGREGGVGTLPEEPCWLSQGASGLHSAQTPAEASASQEMFRFLPVTFRSGHGQPGGTRRTTDKGTWSSLALCLVEFSQIKTKRLFLVWAKRKYIKNKSSQFIVTYEDTNTITPYILVKDASYEVTTAFFFFYSKLFLK